MSSKKTDLRLHRKDEVLFWEPFRTEGDKDHSHLRKAGPHVAGVSEEQPYTFRKSPHHFLCHRKSSILISCSASPKPKL